LNSQPRIGIPARFATLASRCARSSDEVTIWTCEVWGTKEQHDASLQLAETREAISRAMPLIAGDFTRFETEVRGGLGL
jgi:hypothetical protein